MVYNCCATANVSFGEILKQRYASNCKDVKSKGFGDACKNSLFLIFLIKAVFSISNYLSTIIFNAGPWTLPEDNNLNEPVVLTAKVNALERFIPQ